MYKVLATQFKSILASTKAALRQFKNQYAYELKNISPCAKTGKHWVQVKITGKGQFLNYSAEEVAADNNFLLGFCPTDIRTIVYLATSDKYEAILEEEKIKKSLEMIRSGSIKGNKSVVLRDKLSGECFVKTLKEFNDVRIIEKLNSHDAFSLGYLTGQEQAWSTSIRLKIIDKSDKDLNHE